MVLSGYSVALRNYTGAVFLVAAAFIAVPASAQPSSAKSTLCQFTSGPRRGQTQDYAPREPLPVGSTCNDGQRSVGRIVASTRARDSEQEDEDARGNRDSARKSTLCRFTSGPRRGETQDFAPREPLPVGSTCNDGQGSVGRIVAHVLDGSIGLPAKEPPSRLTGRKLLVRSSTEAPGYGLYSYLLFASAPSNITRPRYESAVRAFFQILEGVQDLEVAGMQRRRLNITYLPVSVTPNSDKPEVDWVIENYDYSRAQVLLSKLPGSLRTQGPYIISTLRPLSSSPPDSFRFLYQDLSTTPPTLIISWLREFVLQASQDRFWEERKLSDFVLTLRTGIELAALALPDVKRASSDWKSFLTTVIEVK